MPFPLVTNYDIGDPVWFRQTCRGGYGFQRDVPAIFIARHPSRVTILVQVKGGVGKKVVVHLKNIRPREVKPFKGASVMPFPLVACAWCGKEADPVLTLDTKPTCRLCAHKASHPFAPRPNDIPCPVVDEQNRVLRYGTWPNIDLS